MIRTRFTVPVVVAALLVAVPAVAQRAPFTVGPVTAAAGEKVSGFLEVPAGVDDATRIPVTVIHGTSDGPVLALIGGTHGYEYAPIVALQRVKKSIDPEKLSGTLILVHVANLPSFLGRTIYYSPVDGKNLNRVYPGKPDGTVSERIAHAITTEVIERADYVADMHCGDGNESLRPYTYWMQGGNAQVDEASKRMAIAFGNDHIVIDTDRPSDPGASVYTANTAITRGKPAITTETGALGETSEEWVGIAERGAWNLLKHFGMVEGNPQHSDSIIWLDKYEVVRSPATGLFYPEVKRGHTVAKGTLLGRVTDFFGKTLAEVRAPFGGMVNYVVTTPPITEGEPLAMVSRIQRDGM